MAVNCSGRENIRTALLVYNENAGRQVFCSMRSRINEVFRLLKRRLGPGNVRLELIGSFGDLYALAASIAARQVDWVIVAGGDGTIRALLERLLLGNCRPYVSVFPAGTANLIAGELLMSAEPAKWIRRIEKGIEVPAYPGWANGHLFLTVAGVGFDSLVVDKVTALEKKVLNKFAYVLQGTETVRRELILSDWQYQFEVRFDEEDVWHTGVSVLAGKSRYYAGRYRLFEGAALASPFFHVALFKKGSRRDFLRYAAAIAMEAINRDESVFIRRAQKLEVRCNKEAFAVELDGDAVTSTPLVLEIGEKPIVFLV